MDKLANRLKADAERIEVRISDELERRLEASLQGASTAAPVAELQGSRSAGFWWASTLTGVAAALILVIVVNLRSPTELSPDPLQGTSPVASVPPTPVIDWKTESAMLTSPLRQELEDLQSDIKKAEQKVREDIGL